MEEILTTLTQLLATVISMLVIYLVGKLRVVLIKRLELQDTEMLDKAINDLCLAAEQQFKVKDPTGHLRNQYVKTMLVRAGYQVTEMVMAKVEATVFNIRKGDCTNAPTPTISNAE